jgi:hypothetical protein
VQGGRGRTMYAGVGVRGSTGGAHSPEIMRADAFIRGRAPTTPYSLPPASQSVGCPAHMLNPPVATKYAAVLFGRLAPRVYCTVGRRPADWGVAGRRA